jgi:Holliday junction resolvasome RuvABC endonuclease subunit
MTTPRVIGLDLSLTATGYADFTRDGQMRTATVHSKPATGVTGTWHRLNHILGNIDALIEDGPFPALVVIEGPSFGSKGAGTWDRAGLWWRIVSGLLTNTHIVAVVPPSTLKRYAAGRGNATKTDMAVALAKRADGLELRDDNQVDAWWLAAAGRQHLGHPVVDVPKTHRDALAKVAWPEVPRVGD